MRKIYDAVVIGSGAAAYCAADRLYGKNIRNIAVVTEGRLCGTSRNTGSDKQTYYKLSMDGSHADCAGSMARDICAGGSCDGEKAYIQAVNSARCFLRLCEYGVGFPTDEFGGYPGYKTDHDGTLRATSAGPLTSKYMTEALENAVLNINGTPLLDNRQVVAVVTDSGCVAGVLLLNTLSGKIESVCARNIIVATGAPACIYSDSVYPLSQHGMTGVLIDAGVTLCNCSQWQYGLASTDFRWNVSGSFMQVVPKFVSVDSSGIRREFLPGYLGSAAEAMNNVFLKGYQWPFCSDRLDGSSRVDLAVDSEIKLGRQVYLDYTADPDGFSIENLSEEARQYLTKSGAVQSSPIERLAHLNPKAIAVYARHGIDLARQGLRVAVCAQHNNGGAYADRNYMTDIAGLYVIGEAAGSFGLTRPGGTALNDTQVGGLVCARHIAVSAPSDANPDAVAGAEKRLADTLAGFEVDGSVDYSYIPQRMSRCAAFLRDGGECEALLGEVGRLIENYPLRHRSLRDYFRDRDMLLSAKALLQTVTAEMPLTGSRGGAVYTEGGKVIPENISYRRYLTLTKGGKVSFRKVTPVPEYGEPFENYLNKTGESYTVEGKLNG